MQRGQPWRKQYGWGREKGPRRTVADKRSFREVPSPLGPFAKDLLVFESIQLSDHARISDCQFVASYNLTNEKENNLIVPGMPARWIQPSEACRPLADQGGHYVDDNSARFQQHPFEPLMRSVFLMQPSFEPLSTDVVADSESLDNLFRFSAGKPEHFSLTVKIIGQTVFFGRRLTSPDQKFETMKGFGFNYKAMNRQWSVPQSASHQRIISYTLCGLKIIVRYEVDCCLPAENDSTPSTESSPDQADLSLDTDSTSVLKPAKVSAGGLVIEEQGSAVAQSDIIDLKTRADNKERSDIMATQLPRLWVRQITKSALAFHRGGVFEPVTPISVSNELKQWEQDNQKEILRYVHIIKELKQAAFDDPHGQIEVRCLGPSSLELHTLAPEQVGKWNAASEEMQSKWSAQSSNM